MSSLISWFYTMYIFVQLYFFFLLVLCISVGVFVFSIMQTTICVCTAAWEAVGKTKGNVLVTVPSALHFLDAQQMISNGFY